ncbi:hypothetical protein [Halalkalibaculum sp. DA384]|uniref:hypothetical protein n=1 Tax=Halalkalibaculum sp. DA384 TaxID=3373606 RepID=UPI003754E3F3
MNQARTGYVGAPTLADAERRSGGLADVINSDFATVNILERFPKQGQPPRGVPFSVKIEVQTFRSGGDFWRTPFACLDAFVVARGLYQHQDKILGSSFVRTDAFRGCRGEATLTFSPEFRAGPTDWVRFEIYKGGTQELFEDRTTLQRVKNGEVEMVAQSEPMRFNASQDELYKAGVITEPESVFKSFQNPLFSNLRSTVGSVTMLVGVSLAAYLVWKNGDAIKRFVSTKMDAVAPTTLKKKLTG